MVRVEGPPLRSAATLLFGVSEVEYMSSRFGTWKGNMQPCPRVAAVLDRLGGLSMFTMFLSRAQTTRSLSSAGQLKYQRKS